MTLAQHLDSALTPKRILALDGGGIRGALTLGYLKQIETLLREKHGNPNLLLCDYFDLIGGTSTGSIIAAALAVGKSVDEIQELYFELGGKIFGKKYRWWNVFEIDDVIKAAYDQKPLEEELQKVFGADTTLGSDKLRTGLCIVAKRADTNSVWPLLNHPQGKYYDSAHGHNKNIPLWQAVRASAAAPTYFVPQIIDVGGELSQAAFVDGGVSMANNPALQLLMVATLKGFPFHWKTGADNLLLVSVGTGMSKWHKLPKKLEKNHLLNWASQLPDMLMQDASWHNQMMLQWLSNSPTAWTIDSEIGTMEGDLLANTGNNQGVISYLRYNLWLDAESLKSVTGKLYDDGKIDSLVEMSNAENRFELYELGEKAAVNEVRETHFPDSFNITF
jgi:patatin-like phospholipase/acyl hydrolase